MRKSLDFLTVENSKNIKNWKNKGIIPEPEKYKHIDYLIKHHKQIYKNIIKTYDNIGTRRKNIIVLFVYFSC